MSGPRVAFMLGVPASRRARWRAAIRAARAVLRGQPAGALLIAGDVDITGDLTMYGSMMVAAEQIVLPVIEGPGEGWWMDEQEDGSWLARAEVRRPADPEGADNG